MRILVADIIKNEGRKVELMGWVAVRRDHGKIIFIDLRDRSGICQLVFLGKDKEIYEKAAALRSEWVIRIAGQVNKRPANMVNKDLVTGEHEILVEELEVLNEAKTPPFDLGTDGLEVGEDVRMKYRYLDLRRPRLQNNIRNRDKVIAFMRDFLRQRDFVEVETPLLSKSTPEGARDYLVPSRLYHGSFYALPQSPQQYKQLLMVAGIERYFQVARCFRDEDTRGDRQPEFTQLDMELSFVKEDDVMELTEEMFISLIKTLYPEKKIQQIPFPRVTYREVMEQYASDRPDLRKDKEDKNLLAFCWVIDFPLFKRVKNREENRFDYAEGWTFTHNPFSSPKPEHLELLMRKEDVGEILATQYDLVLNGLEIGGGSIRNHKPEALEKVFEIIGLDFGRIRENFSHIIEALASGAPPHGGIASGIDRVMMILENEPNIREVIAFPKTGDGRDLMMAAPSEVDKEQLNELGLTRKILTKIKKK